MYVLIQTTHSATLAEMTQAELNAACVERGEAQFPHYRRVDGTYAHRWVKDGGHHSTPLYLDAGRIRYARDGI